MAANRMNPTAVPLVSRAARDPADEKEIKASYRRLARKYHPDVSQARDAENRLNELGHA